MGWHMIQKVIYMGAAQAAARLLGLMMMEVPQQFQMRLMGKN